MSQVESPVNSAVGLSQLGRITYAFTAPSKTFEDIQRGNRSWWLPFIVLAIVGYLLFGAIIQHVGIQQTIQNQIRMSPMAQERLSQASPEQLEKGASFSETFVEGTFLAGPVISLLAATIVSGVLLGTINFAFGGRARFGDLLAVSYYAWLPSAVQTLMGIAVMWFQPPETFNVKNFAPTNAAALFLDPASSNQVLYALLTQIDITTLWALVLFSIGVSTVAGVKRSAGYITVFGWWALYVIFRMTMAAIFS